MKHFVSLFLLANVVFSGTVWAENQPWRVGKTGFQSAMAEQTKNGEPILLYFYTRWCPYCRNFEKKTLYTPEVQKGLSGALKVKVDVDRERDLAADFGVTSFPRVYVVDAQGKAQEIGTATDPDRFLRTARRFGIKIQ